MAGCTLSKTGIRVNAMAPGISAHQNQNKFLMIDEKTGDLSPRAIKILNGTPMEQVRHSGEELTGTLLYLVSDLSKFVTGIVIPIDGGFSAYSGFRLQATATGIYLDYFTNIT